MGSDDLTTKIAENETNSFENETNTSCTKVSKGIEKKARKNAKTKKCSTRAPSSYVLFSMEYRKEVKEANIEMGFRDVSKKCGEKWSSLSNDEKAYWKDKSDTLKQERNPVVVDTEPKKKRKPSSYLRFYMDHRKLVVQTEPSLKLGEISKRCGEAWKQLSNDEKEAWKIKANEM